MAKQFTEIGTDGLQETAGFIEKAYNAKLYWPAVYPLYNRIRRSDPEISIVRQAFTTFARSVSITWETVENPTPDDKKAKEFAEQATNDITGGIAGFLETLTSYVPFMGWAWWEALPGIRSPDWNAPGDDPWKSQYDDGLIGFRRLAFRDHSSFYKWDIDKDTGRLLGMEQMDLSSSTPSVKIPLENSIHIKYGDLNNPEGLAGLEPIWRLEQYKYGLEIVQGIGYEHAAGYLDITYDGTLSDADATKIKRIARAVATAQEGNYTTWPKGVKGEFKDVTFSVAESILKTIKFYAITKLMIFSMQGVAMSTISGTGSFAAVSDSSEMAVFYFNAMMEGFVDQFDRQFGARLFTMNPDAFPGMTSRPIAKAVPVAKDIALPELSQFATAMKLITELTTDDLLAIRRASGILPEVVKDAEETEEVPDQEVDEDEAEDALEDVEMARAGIINTDMIHEELIKMGIDPEKSTMMQRSRAGLNIQYQWGELAKRNFIPAPGENMIDVRPESQITQKDVDRFMRKFKKAMRKEEPRFAKLLDAKVVEDE